MQPIVCADDNHFDRQTRAYAEFRLFSRLTAERAAVESAVVSLQPSDTREHYTVCRITVVTSEGEILQAIARESHPYAAIDVAVADIAQELPLGGDVRTDADGESA